MWVASHIYCSSIHKFLKLRFAKEMVVWLVIKIAHIARGHRCLHAAP